jgi:hypothetical protein
MSSPPWSKQQNIFGEKLEGLSEGGTKRGIGSTAWRTIEFALCVVEGKTKKGVITAELKRNKNSNTEK